MNTARKCRTNGRARNDPGRGPTAVSSVRNNVVVFPLERRQAPRLVDLAELREQLGMSERFWRYRIAEGMPVHRYGKRLRFDLSEVQRWIEERYGA
jgi:predicted DNA-binding transcriptional regulator AlpA